MPHPGDSADPEPTLEKDLIMAVQVTISGSSGAYSVSPSAPSSANAASFQLTNNCTAGVTVFFAVFGTPATQFPASQDIAAGQNYTTPQLNSGSVVFTVVPQGGSDPMHVIHIGSTMH